MLTLPSTTCLASPLLSSCRSTWSTPACPHTRLARSRPTRSSPSTLRPPPCRYWATGSTLSTSAPRSTASRASPSPSPALRKKMPSAATSPSTPSSITSTPAPLRTLPAAASTTLRAVSSARRCRPRRLSSTTRSAFCAPSALPRASATTSSSRSWRPSVTTKSALRLRARSRASALASRSPPCSVARPRSSRSATSPTLTLSQSASTFPTRSPTTASTPCHRRPCRRCRLLHPRRVGPFAGAGLARPVDQARRARDYCRWRDTARRAPYQHLPCCIPSPSCACLCPGQKGRLTPLAQYHIVSSIKRSNRDAALVATLHAVALAFRDVLTGASPDDRASIGAILRMGAKHHWDVALALAAILLLPSSPVPAVETTPTEIAASFSADAHPDVYARYSAMYARVRDFFGSNHPWDLRPALSGSDIIAALNLSRGGPIVGEVTQALIAAQLAHPDRSSDDWRAWVVDNFGAHAV
ncbi:uncharacterized protein AMSG_07843 [Thecamonas trahens ATCC 50062]|uniref:Uncharacterized protein n=1 Tax=Thecamonas trahens ATCC 50062 TaxID=461836 RepID=A0A0L0DK75_THETB|nr:hypothetical protein AMSG_07843 [Thecamonas trahens ATCC 50062]KNC51768.1 hypothetical protein AMSG_07843 [Thecamonas trahens ATCC 50062]|eukprot:XP_013755641.1 hypothetical protein AMSG_07843 [Thecamonas trahens ATCC 50062]